MVEENMLVINDNCEKVTDLVYNIKRELNLLYCWYIFYSDHVPRYGGMVVGIVDFFPPCGRNSQLLPSLQSK